MKDIKQMFAQTDFSRHTDLKERLAKTLFGAGSAAGRTSSAFQQLSDDDMELVNAAQGLYVNKDDPNQNKW